MARPLYRGRQHALMMGAASGNPAGDNFPALGHEPAQQAVVAIINLIDSILAKAAMSFSSLFHLCLYLF